MFPSASNRIMREELTSDPLFSGASGSRGSNNVDVFYNDRFPPASTSNTNRQRTYDNIPLAFLLYSVCFALANNASIRDQINVFLAQGPMIPVFFQEKLNSCRRSTCGNLRITPTSGAFVPVEILESLLLRNSIFDMEYLVTPQGLSSIFGFFGRLHGYSDSYIPLMKGYPVLLDSGFQTTECSVTCETAGFSPAPTTRTETRTQARISGTPTAQTTTIVAVPQFSPGISPDKLVKLAPGNAYGMSANLVQVLDSWLLDRTLGDGTNQIIVGIYGATADIQIQSFNQSAYMIQRVTGIIHNSIKVSKDTFPPEPPASPTEGFRANTPKPSAPRDKSRGSRRFIKAANDVKSFINVIASLLRDKLITQQQFMKLITS